MVNAFNANILELHRANMDIQFILDPYACCGYINKYINKSNRGVSRLLRQAIDEVNAGNFTIQQKLRHIGSKFISSTEISAQEAVYCTLGMHLSECSNAKVYINTNKPTDRVKMLKSRAQLENLSAEPTDVFIKGLIEHYIQRPDSLNSTCLACLNLQKLLVI